ncbi:TMEM175 family protein [Undibacterium flavidum]|uniref:DUF1211 domain-containing protein n=1 Tax=Undibacterium flavidum TaxID=2762297 RepID=A0ABR6YDC1_9BURK|nr:TMEM175 family protein [Undibacterium flavidum]MBC3874546.1 DUF1211 domain-containing protein [Undibacterium flavidum]
MHAQNQDLNAHGLLSKHRLEALTDGVYAVALTILVLEMKVPEALHGAANNAALLEALWEIFPKFLSWFISFFVLAIFWLAHHRLFHYAPCINVRLVFLNFISLFFASMIPFSSALIGQHSSLALGHTVYAGNMIMLALLAWLQLLAVRDLNTQLGSSLPPGFFAASRFRLMGLVACSLCAIGIAFVAPIFSSNAFLGMIIFGRLSRRMQTRAKQEFEREVEHAAEVHKVEVKQSTSVTPALSEPAQ